MAFVRGSHRWGQGTESDFFGQDLEALRARIEASGDGRWEEAPAILPPGGVSFHHSLTYHGSGPNLSGSPRRSFAIHLRTENSRPRDDQRQGLTEFIDNLDYCPVIYGRREAFRG
jgi:ectoine hydroxylase-related dioxygenase (phytanoyl-CoA dioxygenase family)